MADNLTSKAKAFVTKALGIKLQQREPYYDRITRGESVLSSDSFVEQEPRTAEFLLRLIPTGPQIWQYFLSLFPFLSWIGHYNLQWFLGDLVAGKNLSVSRRSANANHEQVLPSALSSYHKAWPMPNWLTSRFSLASTLHS